MTKLQKKIHIYDNVDKKDHETNIKGEPTYLRHPCSCVFIAPTSHGKSNLISNLLLDAYRVGRPYERLLLCHYLGDLTHEYDMFSDIMEKLPEVPTSIDELKLDKSKKTVLVFEDIDPRGLSHAQRSFLDRCFGVICSHMGCSVFVSSQQIIAVPIGMRRLAQHFYIWNCGGGNKEDLILLARKCGIKKQELEYYFENVCKSKYDCVHINVYDTEAPKITLNMHEVIREK
jgi:hypothetical protein